MDYLGGTWQLEETNITNLCDGELVFYYFGIDGIYRRISPFRPKNRFDPVVFAVLKYEISENEIIFKSFAGRIMWKVVFAVTDKILNIITETNEHSLFRRIQPVSIPEEVVIYINKEL